MQIYFQYFHHFKMVVFIHKMDINQWTIILLSYITFKLYNFKNKTKLDSKFKNYIYISKNKKS